MLRSSIASSLHSDLQASCCFCLQVLLDDHLVKLQAMAASPFGKAFEGDIQPWSSLLKRLQDTLEQWLMCQVSLTDVTLQSWLPSEQGDVLLALLAQ